MKKLLTRILTISLLVSFFFASSPLTFAYASEVVGGAIETEGAQDDDEEAEESEQENNENEEGTDEATEGGDESINEEGADEEETNENEETEEINEGDEEEGGDEQVEALSLTTEEEESSEGEEDSITESTDADIINENTAEVVNEIESASNTGGNVVDETAEVDAGEEGGDEESVEEPELEEDEVETNETAIIETGDSLSAVNLVNLLNTNISDSEGLILFLQSLVDSGYSLDLRDFAYLFDEDALVEGCGELVCGVTEGSIVVHNSNDVSIINTVKVSASTGDNTGYSDGTAIINTGDAYASANILNIANTNIVGSKYLILNFDSFGDFSGDIVFPSAVALQKFFTAGVGAGAGGLDIENENNVEVLNAVGTSADTGNNTANSDDTAAIETGKASAYSNIFNQLNTNLFNSGNFSVVFRVHGDWIGDVFSLPEGVSYGGDGGAFFFDVSGGTTHSSLGVGSVSIQNTNNAYIENNILVSAETGGNMVIGEDGALISTGDAYASANITNVANTNIIGQNWILAIINIFGDFTGNVSFGKPDLWVGERIEVGRNVKNGSELNYIYTITNNGDTAATGVELVDLFNIDFVNPLSFFGDATRDGDEIIWNIGTLGVGETVEIGFTGETHSLPYGETEIINNVRVSAHEPDENTDDNSDTATVRAYVERPQKRGQLFETTVLTSSVEEVLTALTVLRTNSATDTVSTGEEVTYTLVVTNVSDESVYNTVLTDELHSPRGEVLHTEIYLLGEVFPGEKVTIEYTVLFDESFESGVYASHATLVGSEEEDSLEIRSASYADYVTFQKTPPPAEPTRVEPVVARTTSVPLVDLSGLIPVAHAANSIEGDGVISSQAASLGLLGLNTNHLVFIIVVLYLAYIGTQKRYRYDERV